MCLGAVVQGQPLGQAIPRGLTTAARVVPGIGEHQLEALA
jgi:hypothetical protein